MHSELSPQSSASHSNKQHSGAPKSAQKEKEKQSIPACCSFRREGIYRNKSTGFSSRTATIRKLNELCLPSVPEASYEMLPTLGSTLTIPVSCNNNNS
jgi:hypothetical protein